MAIEQEEREWFRKVVETAMLRALEASDVRFQNIVNGAMEQHKKDAITHNPVKAITTGTALIGIIEWLRSLIRH